MLGISPLLPHGPPVVMISYALWQGRYGGDRQIIGREINIQSGKAGGYGCYCNQVQYS
jgi:hypothetical protein